jgi:hypothetical protein
VFPTPVQVDEQRRHATDLQGAGPVLVERGGLLVADRVVVRSLPADDRATDVDEDALVVVIEIIVVLIPVLQLRARTEFQRVVADDAVLVNRHRFCLGSRCVLEPKPREAYGAAFSRVSRLATASTTAVNVGVGPMIMPAIAL